MLFLLTVRLKQIAYSGDNIGNDLSFRFNVEGHGTLLRSKIALGQRGSFDKVLLQEIFPEGSHSLPIRVDITEEDPAFNDTGSASSRFNMQLEQPETRTHSFSADVIASGGDKAKKATFTFMGRQERREKSIFRLGGSARAETTELLTGLTGLTGCECRR